MISGLGLGTGWGPALTVLATGAGGMVVSHANDSYFWVVSKFSDLDVPTAYKVHTSGTLVEGIVTMAGIWIVSRFLL
jgi:GntP family gluconate:H+ symporter